MASSPDRFEFSQLFQAAALAHVGLCRSVRSVRRHPLSSAHVHDFFELSFVREGHYDLIQPGRASLRLNAGDMFLLPPGIIHYERYARGVRPRVGWLGFGLPGDLPLAVAIRAKTGCRLRQPDAPENLETLAAEILSEQTTRAPGWEQKLTAALARLLVLVLRAPPAESPPGGDSRSPSASTRLAPHTRTWVNSAAHHLENHCGEPLSIRKVAASFGCSHAHFSSLFRRHFGVTPRRFLIAARLNRARRLLAEDRLTHAAIAQECGFYDEAHFSRAFRALTGVPPSRYQRTPDDVRASL